MDKSNNVEVPAMPWFWPERQEEEEEEEKEAQKDDDEEEEDFEYEVVFLVQHLFSGEVMPFILFRPTRKSIC